MYVPKILFIALHLDVLLSLGLLVDINNVSIYFFYISVAVTSGGKMKIVEEPNTFGSGFQQTLPFKYEIYLNNSI